eukprot:14977440-Ditylum_brightwellii.AAC.1
MQTHGLTFHNLHRHKTSERNESTKDGSEATRLETGPILRVCGRLIGLEIAMLFTLGRCIGIQGEHIDMKRWIFRP